MALEERVVCAMQAELEFLECVSGDGFRVFVALAVAAAEDFVNDHQLSSGHFAQRGVGGVNVDELDDPVGVSSGGRGEEIGYDVAGDGHWVVEDGCLPGGDVASFA